MTFSKALFIMTLSLGTASYAAEPFKPTLNTFGATGLIDTPTAETQRDAEINTTVSVFAGTVRNTLTFQILPRLSGSFRYSRIGRISADGSSTFDRSFDLRYKALDEGKYRPAVTIGLQDFVGTGIYSGEYIVATKRILPTLKATVGIGWGRLAGQERNLDVGVGGTVDVGSFFSGTPHFFGGIEWQTPIKNLNLKIERSADNYLRETQAGSFDIRSQFNFGLDYRLSKTANLSLNYLYGSEIGLQVSFALNPKYTGNPSGLEGAGLPILKRPTLKHKETYDTAWSNIKTEVLFEKLTEKALSLDGLQLEALKITGTTAKIYIRNIKYRFVAQAAGRTARIFANYLPPSVETFEIIPVSEGLPLRSIILSRTDLETYEQDPDGADKVRVRSRIVNAPTKVDEDALYAEGLYPKFIWSLKPSIQTSLFDPDSPLRVGAGLRLRGSYTFAPGLSVSGSALQPLIGNLNNGQVSNSALEPVRTNTNRFIDEGDPAITRLTADYLFKFTPDIYARTSLGYLESQFGGVSTEVLWRPDGRKFAIGAELNYVQQRNFDQRFGFQDYSVATGHVSLYRDLWNGFTAQIDAGRYLAGDVGATLSINRTFKNGWSLGVFATLTDVPFERFGEGSFDRGITMSVPLGQIFGNSTRKTQDFTIRSIQRDGGARLNVSNRLFGVTDDYDRSDFESSFGRFWR